MDGKDKFGTYRYAMALIKGEFKEGGPNEADIKDGFTILKKISEQVTDCFILVSGSDD